METTLASGDFSPQAILNVYCVPLASVIFHSDLPSLPITYIN